MIGIRYLFGKVLQKMQIATLRGCDIDRTSRVCQRSNLINVRMGRYSYMGYSNSCSNVEIGSFCSIASNCSIGGGDHPMDFVSTSPVFLRGRNIMRKNFTNLEFDESKRVIIGNDVWIGEACFIVGGVALGNGSVIGAHSVVTHDVPPYAIAVGAPARIVRYRFDEDTISKLESLQWWDWDDETIDRYADCFDDPRTLISTLDKGRK